MAIVKKKGIIASALSGTLGSELVFRKRSGGKSTVVAVPPSEMAAPSENQLKQRDRFKKAIEYAKRQMADPLLKARYEALAKSRRKPSAFSVAVIDYFEAPQIGSIDATAYAGAIGNTIRIAATDDFDVSQVRVTIQEAGGATLEAGNAVREVNTGVWIYTATVVNGAVVGSKVVVVATDLSGNSATEEKVLS